MTANSHEFRQRLARVEELVRTLEDCPDPIVREAARELVRSLLDLHAAGLARILELAEPALVPRLASESLVSSLLLLHGIHPTPADERLQAALERARPQLRALGGNAELIVATEERVCVRLGGDPSAGPELKAAVQAIVIDVVPDAATIEFDEAWDCQPDGRVALPILREAT